MSLVTALLAPLALLLPAAGALEPLSSGSDHSLATALRAEEQPNRLALPVEAMLPALDPADSVIFQTIAQTFQIESRNQVRIEQRVTIRITPRASAPQPQMLVELPTRPLPQRLVERDFGSCLSIAGIAGVEVSNTNRLILSTCATTGCSAPGLSVPAMPATIIRASMYSAPPTARSCGTAISAHTWPTAPTHPATPTACRRRRSSTAPGMILVRQFVVGCLKTR